MKDIYDLTPEERKQAKPEGIKQLIKIDEERLKSWALPDYIRKELEKEIKFLKDWLKEIEQ